MRYRPLGEDGPQVPVVCLGAWPLGGGMGHVPEQQAIDTIHASLDAGVSFIDTAEGYRTSEAVIGKALKGRSDEVFIATKLSGDHTREHMDRAIENSLRALGRDHVDLYQLHGPRPETPIDETMANLLRLRDEGKIRYIGVSNFSADQHTEALEHGPVQSSQPRYNMLFRGAEHAVLPTCLKRGVGVIVHSPLAKGMLTGKYRPGHEFPDDDERRDRPVFSQEGFSSAFDIVQQLSNWASDHGRDLIQLAIAWTLAHPAVTSSIVGAKTPDQARHNARAADWALSDGDLAEIGGILGDFELDAV